MKRGTSHLLGRAAQGLAAIVLGGAGAIGQTTTVVSLSQWAPNFTQPSELGVSPISADGRFVVFITNQILLPIDTNLTKDVYLRDRWLDRTELVSVDSSGVVGNNHCRLASISADGDCVVFQSSATNLVPGDTNNAIDLFVHERSTGLTERVNVTSSGAQSSEVYFAEVSISADGRFVVFVSSANNLVPGDTNWAIDLFLRDRLLQQTTRVSVGSSGQQANAASASPMISSDGRLLAFVSSASNLVAGDTNDQADVFLRDLVAGTTERISVSSSGAQTNNWSGFPSVSDDGRFVAFSSGAFNLVPNDNNHSQDVFVRDRMLGTTERVSVSTSGAEANNYSSIAGLSVDGHLVHFTSSASNLVDGDTNGATDSFVHDLATHVTERVNLAWNGGQANGGVTTSSFSSSGRFIAFATGASNVVPGLATTLERVYVRDRTGLSPERYCIAVANSAGCLPEIDWRGVPSATAGRSFLIGAAQVLERRAGLLFYGLTGPLAAPFHGGLLCVRGPLHRTPLQYSSPSGAPPCTGVFAFDFNHWTANHGGPGLKYGDQVWAQCWSRDPAAAAGSSLTDALTFVIGP